MKMLILFPIVLLLDQVHLKSPESIRCPVISRTRQKEFRILQYEECSNITLKACFQQVLLTEIVELEHVSFLFSSGCASQKDLKKFNLTESKFRKLCKESGTKRCKHIYQEDYVYEGTFCCETDADQMFSSWLWNVFFGKSEEMTELLESTVKFLQRKLEGKSDEHKDSRFVYIIGPFFVTGLFTALSLLQYYHSYAEYGGTIWNVLRSSLVGEPDDENSDDEEGDESEKDHHLKKSLLICFLKPLDLLESLRPSNNYLNLLYRNLHACSATSTSDEEYETIVGIEMLRSGEHQHDDPES
ncbi:hypothetical protein GCK72_018276 [Caenorhabditis remanei]|uniref:Uncharacterized protein n=1 Tax=Caenorhabditis remanei TaxID=31234 RepID=A0A6A5GB64_CAERE|nr:hypothetical protein GCK72_018276 [Caenorhabditis remanei]KAF1751722.1 hypothetical protein GCK72_018276 [Caenorhabditis remanei]